jgi:hypothetical protein
MMTPAECVAQLRIAVDGPWLHAAVIVKVGEVPIFVFSFDPDPPAVLEKLITGCGGLAVGLVGPTVNARWEANLFIDEPWAEKYLQSKLDDLESSFVRQGYSIGRRTGGTA